MDWSPPGLGLSVQWSAPDFYLFYSAPVLGLSVRQHRLQDDQDGHYPRFETGFGPQDKGHLEEAHQDDDYPRFHLQTEILLLMVDLVDLEFQGR